MATSYHLILSTRQVTELSGLLHDMCDRYGFEADPNLFLCAIIPRLDELVAEIDANKDQYGKDRIPI